mmetsp:Transcript_97484/g.275763  ORF Transcript_97484/g.275763 Transcript_97484/m.275763 type:complete len:373 (+) Transcript_97484:1004-2122(+)
MLLEVAHAGLTAVPADEGLQRVGLDNSEGHGRGGRLLASGGRRLSVGFLILRLWIRSLRGQANVLHSIRDKVILSDAELFLQIVAGQPDHLHAIEERPWDGVRDVGRTNEEHPAAIDWHVEVMIKEGAILRGIQELEQCRCRITLVPTADLVDLVDEHQRVSGLRLLHALNDLPWHGANVRAPVTFDLGHVVQTADAEAIELAAKGLGDGAADGRLPHTRRADEAKNLSLHRPTKCAHRDELQNPLLHVVEAIMIAVEDGASPLQAERVRAVDPPRHVREPIEVVPRHLVLLRLLDEVGELVHLRIDRVLRVLRYDLVLQALSELAKELVGAITLVLAELLFDKPQLFTEHVLALLSADLFLDLARNLVLQL